MDGRVAALLVREGSTVAKNQTLLQLDDAVQAARVSLAERSAGQTGTVEKARHNLARQSRKLRRLKAARSGSVPKWEVEEAAFQVRIAEADLKVAEDALAVEQGKLALERTVLDQYAIVAPFDGQVVKIDAVPGATVKRSQGLITVADLSALEAVSYVPFRLAAAYVPAKRYPAAVAGMPGVHVTATLKFIDQRLEPASQTYRAVFTIDNRDRRLAAGTEISIGVTPLEGNDQ